MKISTDFLPEKTKKLFEFFSGEKFIDDYVLVGGTALSLSLEHRLSEDLDFIYYGKELDVKKINRFINKSFPNNYKLLKKDDNHQLDYLIGGVKVTFFTTDAVSVNFDVKEYSNKHKNLRIADYKIISVLKILAISQRSTIRDYYDLFYIADKVFPLNKIFKLSKKLLPELSEITYKETLIYTDDISEEKISDLLEPKIKISKQDIAEFFKKELLKLK